MGRGASIADAEGRHGRSYGVVGVGGSVGHGTAATAAGAALELECGGSGSGRRAMHQRRSERGGLKGQSMARGRALCMAGVPLGEEERWRVLRGAAKVVRERDDYGVDAHGDVPGLPRLSVPPRPSIHDPSLFQRPDIPSANSRDASACFHKEVAEHASSARGSRPAPAPTPAPGSLCTTTGSGQPRACEPPAYFLYPVRTFFPKRWVGLPSFALGARTEPPARTIANLTWTP